MIICSDLSLHSHKGSALDDVIYLLTCQLSSQYILFSLFLSIVSLTGDEWGYDKCVQKLHVPYHVYHNTNLIIVKCIALGKLSNAVQDQFTLICHLAC